MQLINVEIGESLAYLTAQGWAYSGHRFSAIEDGQLVTRESFASGAVRFNRYDPTGFAVIRGTEVVPLLKD